MVFQPAIRSFEMGATGQWIRQIEIPLVECRSREANDVGLIINSFFLDYAVFGSVRVDGSGE